MFPEDAKLLGCKGFAPVFLGFPGFPFDVVLHSSSVTRTFCGEARI